MLREKLQGLKEILKKHLGHKLSTLEKMASQIENLPPVLEEMEHEELVCPECGYIFGKVGYKVMVTGL